MHTISICPYLSLGDELYMYKSNAFLYEESGTSAKLIPATTCGDNLQLLHSGADLTVLRSNLYLVRFWANGSWKAGESLFLAVNGQAVSTQQNIWPDLWDFQQEATLLLEPADCLSIEATAPDIAEEGHLTVTLLVLSLD